MKLRQKTIFAITLTLLFIISIQFLILRSILVTNLNSIEQQDAEKNILRVHDAIKEQLIALETKIIDWSMWNDSYQFVQDLNSEFIKNNLENSAFINLKINLFSYFNFKKEIIYGRLIDLTNESVVVTSNSFNSTLKEKYPQIFNFNNNEHHINGVIHLTKYPMIISSQPILKTNGEGPIMGGLIEGIELNGDFIKKISDITHLNITLITADESKNKRTSSPIFNLKKSEEYIIDIKSEEILTGYSLFQDLNGQNSFYLSVEIPRDIHRYAKATLLSFLITIITGSFLLIFTLNFVMNKSIVKPVVSLNQKVQEITEKGDLNLKVDIIGNDEIAELSKKMNTMLSTIKESQDAQQRLLNNTSQGFLIFDQQGLIHSQFSKSVLTIFAKNPSGEHISTLFNHDFQTWSDYTQLLFTEDVPFNDLISICPKEIQMNNRFIEIQYQDIRDINNKISHIMVIATDVTEVKKLQKERELEQKINSALIKILISKNDFIETVEMVHSLNEAKHDIKEFKRKIHTLKGAFAFLGLYQFSEMCHEAENKINSDNNSKVIDSITEEIKEAIKQFIDDYDNIIRVKGTNEKSISISCTTIHQLIDFAYEQKTPVSVIAQLEMLVERPVHEVLGWIDNVLSVLADKQGKEVNPVIWVPSATIDPAYYVPLFKSLIHIPRNFIDHGLELPDEREQKGKPRNGTMVIELKFKDSYYILSFHNDGAGADKEKIASKAKQLGLKEPTTSEELSELLCRDGFSTKEIITETSGRGIGLSAVCQEAQRLGGGVQVFSQEEDMSIIVSFKKFDRSSQIHYQTQSGPLLKIAA